MTGSDAGPPIQATILEATNHSWAIFALRIVRVVVPIVFYPLAVALAAAVIVNSNEQALATKHAASLSTAGSKGSYAGKWLLEGISFGWYSGASLVDADYEQAVEYAAARGHESGLASWLLAALVAAYVAWAMMIRRFPFAGDQAHGRRLLVRHLCGASLVLFAVGIAATALSLVSFQEVPVMGTVIFKYESRGIVTAILSLFSSGHSPLAVLIALFSIVIPVVKMVAMVVATSTRRGLHDRAVMAIKAMGKWSMADVFVISVLLAMFAIGSDETTDARPGPGLYFFAAYCLLSMVAAAWIVEPERFITGVLDWRIWKSADECVSQEAAFLDLQNGMVHVLTRRGTRARLSLEALSAEDRAYAKTREAAASDALFDPVR